MNGKIYKITNDKTGECYIGQTTQTVEERFLEYKRGCFNQGNKSNLQEAMLEDGPNHFHIETLKEGITSQSELTALETYYIVKYNALEQYNSNYGNGPKHDRSTFNSSIRQKEKPYKPLEFSDNKSDDFWLDNSFTKEIKNTKFKVKDLNVLIYLLYNAQQTNKNKFTLYFEEVGQFLDWDIYRRYRVAAYLKGFEQRYNNLFNIHYDKIDEITLTLTPYVLSFIQNIEKHRRDIFAFNYKEFALLKGYSKLFFFYLKNKQYAMNYILDTPDFINTFSISDSYTASKIKLRILTPIANELEKYFHNLHFVMIRRNRAVVQYKIIWNN